MKNASGWSHWCYSFWFLWNGTKGRENSFSETLFWRTFKICISEILRRHQDGEREILFFNYILLIILLLLSWFSPPSPLPRPPPSTAYSLSPSPHHCSCPWVMCISSLATPFPILYFTSPWLFCNYLFILLNPLAFSPIPHTPSYLTTIKRSGYPWFCLYSSCFLSLFLDSIVNRCVFIVILLFIVLIFFFLNKSL